MEESIADYKAKVARDEEEMANWRRKAHEEEDEMNRMREISDHDKAATTQLSTELSSAQADAAAAAANATAVRKELDRARAQVQQEKADIKQVLLQRTDSEESMEESLADYKAKLAASQNATIFANAKTASLALKLERLSDMATRETEVSKRLTGSLHHAEAAAAAADAARATATERAREVATAQRMAQDAGVRLNSA